MRSASRFFLYSSIFLSFCYLGILILYASQTIDKLTFLSIALAAAVSLINFLLGIWFYKIGINRSNSIFFISVLGGIVIRLIVMLMAVLMCLIFLELNRISFIFSIFIFYFLHLSIEVIYLNLRKS